MLGRVWTWHKLNVVLLNSCVNWSCDNYPRSHESCKSKRLPELGRENVINPQSWTKVLGTVLQYSYVSVTSVFPLTVHTFRKFLAPPPPPPTPHPTQSWNSRPTLGWGEELDLCELENPPEMQKCPKTDDCLKKRWEEKRQFWGVFKPEKVFFGLLMKDRKSTSLFPSFQNFLNVFEEFARNEWYTPEIAVSHSGGALFQRIKAQLFCLMSTIYLLIKQKRRAFLLIKQEIPCFLFNKQSLQDKLV